MTIKNLEGLIKNKKAKVAIIGLGYVGLPHAVEIAKAGFTVFGIDIQKKRAENVNKGKSYIEDVKDEELREVVKNGKLKGFYNFLCLKKADIVIICVPTPLDEYKIPDISYIKSSASEVKRYFHRGQLIILESTTYPGTTEEILLPIFEENGLKAGKDFFLSFAPERIDPGNGMPLCEIPKVVGGVTKVCTRLSKLFYEQFLGQAFPVSSPRAAEMTKILENTYRLINISAINEISLLCGKMGIDIWEVIEAAKTKPYGFHPFYPSPKIGGHCIPLDPFYLSWKAKEYNFWARFIELGGEINEQMPHMVVVRIASMLNKEKKSVKGSKILIWGISYKKDIADPRESASYAIIPELMKKEADVDYYDPYNDFFEVGGKKLKSIKNTPENIKKYDLVLILTDHSGVNYDDLAKNARLVLDTRNAIKSRKYKNVVCW
jgi:UDP-N-acetyl-D-glucosamine dehydrogenase